MVVACRPKPRGRGLAARHVRSVAPILSPRFTRPPRSHELPPLTGVGHLFSTLLLFAWPFVEQGVYVITHRRGRLPVHSSKSWPRYRLPCTLFLLPTSSQADPPSPSSQLRVLIAGNSLSQAQEGRKQERYTQDPSSPTNTEEMDRRGSQKVFTFAPQYHRGLFSSSFPGGRRVEEIRHTRSEARAISGQNPCGVYRTRRSW